MLGAGELRGWEKRRKARCGVHYSQRIVLWPVIVAVPFVFRMEQSHVLNYGGSVSGSASTRLELTGGCVLCGGNGRGSDDGCVVLAGGICVYMRSFELANDSVCEAVDLLRLVYRRSSS